MTRYYLLIGSLLVSPLVFAKTATHTAPYPLPLQTEIIVNHQPEQNPSSEIKVSVKITPKPQAVSTQLFNPSQSEVLNQHALALAQQTQLEELPQRQTSAKQGVKNPQAFFSSYVKDYYFISMQHRTVVQRIRRIVSPSSLSDMACSLIQQKFQSEQGAVKLNVMLYVDKQGQIHYRDTQPALEKSLFKQLFPSSHPLPFYKIFDMERQQYTDTYLNQPVRLICAP